MSEERVLDRKPPTIRERYIDDSLKRLKRDNEYFVERAKVFERRLDFMQDEFAKLVIEQQSFIKANRIILDIGHALMDKHEKAKKEAQVDPGIS